MRSRLHPPPFPPRHRRAVGTSGIVVLLMVLTAVPTYGNATSSSGSSATPASDLVPLSAPVALGAPSDLGNFDHPSPVAGSTPVNATITLSSRDLAALESYGSNGDAPPLTPSQVQEEFGPSASGVSALRSYLAEEGLGVQAPADGWVWLVHGTASDLERAFDTTLEEYQPTAAAVASGAVTDAPTIAYTSIPQLPAGLPVSALSAVSPSGNLRPLSEVVPAPTTPLDPSGSSAPTPAEARSSCPNGSLTPSSVENAYNITPVLQSGDEGQGERIGIVDAFDSAENEYRIVHDLASFSSCYGLPDVGQGIQFAWPVPGPTNLNESNSSGWGVEIALDTQWAHATAPDANLTLVLSPNDAYGLYYGVDWLVATRDVDVISLSWGEPETGVFNFGPCSWDCNASTDGTLATLTPVFAAAAAEGMQVFAASGDCGANGGTLGYSTWYPASDPHVVGVGGSVLNLTASGAYGSETAWDGTASFCFNGGGSGGGFSVLPRPSWQSGTGFSRYLNSTRGVPDVGLVAAVPLGIYYDSSPTYVEGTSDAAPQWSGMAALIGEQRGLGGLPGFLTPQFYEILRSPSYSTDFHSISTGWNGFASGPGWDPITGVGSPQFSSLLATILAGPRPTIPATSTITFSAQPQAGVGPLPVDFTAGALPTGETGANYTFYYGDVGAPYEEANASTVGTNTSSTLYPAAAEENLTYSQAGAYTAFASVTDTQDNVSLSIPVAVNVGNAGPLQVQVITTAGTAGMPTLVEATAAGGTAPYRFSYFFGDGTYESGWADDGPTISHTYTSNGTYLLGIVANDSSDPMRAGYAVDCVVVGTSSVPCPHVPETLVTDMVPTSNRLTAGGTTMVRVTVTWDGVPVAGASVALAPRYGTVSLASGVTDAAGNFFVNYTAPSFNRSVVFGLFSNATAAGYATGMGAVLFLVDPAAGPSLTPWVRFGEAEAAGGTSVGVTIGGLVAYRNAPATHAAITVAFSGYSSGPTWTGELDATGFYANTWDVPSVPCGAVDPGAEVLTVSLALPGYTTAPTPFDLPLESGGGALCSGGVDVAFAVGPTSTYAMGSVAVTARVTESNGGRAVNVGVANLTIDSEPEGVLTYWRQVGTGVYAGEFSSPIIAASYGELLQLNVTGANGRTNASASALLEVTDGSGAMNISLVASFPASGLLPAAKGNLTVQVYSSLEKIPLDRVYMLVAPSAGDPSLAAGSEIIAWSNAYGNVTFPYQAPNASTTVVVNVQAVGWGIYNFTQANFSLVFKPVPPPPINISRPTIVLFDSERLTVMLTLVAALVGAVVFVFFLFEAIRRFGSAGKGPTSPPPPPSPPVSPGPGTGVGAGTGSTKDPEKAFPPLESSPGRPGLPPEWR